MRRLTLSGAAPLLDPSLDLRRIAGPCVVDLSKLTFATPLDLVAMASLLNSATVSRVTLIPPALPLVANYLMRMDLVTSLDGRVVSSPPFPPETPRDETPSLIEVTCVKSNADVQPIIDRLMPKLATVLPDASCRNVFRIIGELLENATTHGNSESGCFVAGQYYSGTTSAMPPGFWIGIADAGIGFRKHLARNSAYGGLRSTEAIRKASMWGVTGTGDPARGLGLTNVRRAAGHAAPGEVIIRSGDGEGHFFVGPHGATARYRSRPSISGTWVLALAGTPASAM